MGEWVEVHNLLREERKGGGGGGISEVVVSINYWFMTVSDFISSLNLLNTVHFPPMTMSLHWPRQYSHTFK